MRALFDPDLFNPLYWHLQDARHDPLIRFIWVRGGSSAAKTFSYIQATLIDLLQGKGSTMVLRKYGSDIDDSIYREFKEVIYQWGLEDHFTIQQRLIIGPKGDIIRFRGLDDAEKLKGIAAFRWVMMEEINQFDEADLKQVRKRLRGRPGQQIIGLWNPVDENHWLKTNILDVEEWEDLPLELEGSPGISALDPEHSFKKRNARQNAIYFKTTFRDNFWIVGHPINPEVGFVDQHTLDDFEHDRKHDFNFFRIYADGEWGKMDTGAEAYKRFDPAYNTEAIPYDPELPLHLSFDENVNPYMPATVWQAEGSKVWQIDELVMRPKQNNLPETCREFIKRYKGHGSGLVVYGDATSKKKDAKLERGYNFYDLIRDLLSEFHPQFRVPAANPSVMMRILFINEAFRGMIQDVEIIIGKECKTTIEDFKYIKEAPDGSKLKEMVTDKSTKVRYQPYGHLTDSAEYFICEYFRKEFRSWQRGPAKSVSYLAGKKRVVKSY